MKKTLIASLLALSINAHAQTPRGLTGWYIGFGAGQSVAQDADEHCDDFVRRLGVSNPQCDPDDTSGAWKAFGGYQFHPNIAVEFGYVDFGSYDASGRIGGTNLSGTAEARGPFAEVVGLIPVHPNVSILGKAGIIYARTETSISASGAVTGSASATDRSAKPLAGLGVNWNAGHFVIRAEWERFFDVGDADKTGESDIDLFSASLIWRY